MGVAGKANFGYNSAMNTYELTVLFPDPASAKDAKEAESEKTRVMKVIEEFVKKHKGEINKQESWGVKHLAYPIRKIEIGIYEHFVLTLPGSDQPVLDKMLKLEEGVLRYMFVRV